MTPVDCAEICLCSLPDNIKEDDIHTMCTGFHVSSKGLYANRRTGYIIANDVQTATTVCERILCTPSFSGTLLQIRSGPKIARLFVENLPHGCTAKSLATFIQPAGEVSHVHVLSDRRALVFMENACSTLDAKALINRTTSMRANVQFKRRVSDKLEVPQVFPNEPDDPTRETRLYVYNLSPQTTSCRLRDFMIQKHPECKRLVTVVEILTSKVPTCRKAGFVHVTGVNTGKLLCNFLNGLQIDNEVVMAKIQRVDKVTMKRRRGRVGVETVKARQVG